MSVVDPATGDTLSSDAIQRVLFVCHPVHVYAIPPLTSMKGHTAADWTAPDPRNEGKSGQIFTARLRILETATPALTTSEPEKVKTDILLEDPSSGSLFAAAPYTDEGTVEHVVDSSRFFALRVVGDGKKAVLGIGFEDRSEAFDFGVTLQEARKVLGFGGPTEENTTTTNIPPTTKSAPQPPRTTPGAPPGPRGPQMRAPGGRMTAAPAPQGNVDSRPSPQGPPAEKSATPQDYSLKPGQTITLDIGGRRASAAAAASSDEAKNASTTAQDENEALFSIPPPPGTNSSRTDENPSTAFSHISPPPSGRGARTDRRKYSPARSGENSTKSTDNAFDDDEFGDFQ